MSAMSVAEVAARYLPSHWTDAERWLRRRLNRGEISGYQVGREWMMTDADIEDFITRRRNKVELASTPAPATSIVDGLSARTRQRLRRAS
jgi:hypothetical protein